MPPRMGHTQTVYHRPTNIKPTLQSGLPERLGPVDVE